MIEILCDYVDQLDLALDQLALRDRNYDRFAMMLIDNVAELVLHQSALDMNQEYQTWADNGVMSPQDKAAVAALGTRFDAKVSLARMTGLLSPAAAEAVLKLHGFRNTAHHRGYRHEGILHSLSLFYFKLTCDLLTTYNPPYWIIGPVRKLPIRAVKYVGTVANMGERSDVFSSAWKRLKEVAESMGDTLVTDLYDDMRKAIDSGDRDIDFLSSNNPSQPSRDSIVKETQLWAVAISEEGPNLAKSRGYTGSRTAELFAWLMANYPLQVSTDPIPAWEARAESLRTETDPYVALKKYTSFMNQTEELRNQLDEASTMLDQHIHSEMEYDR